MAGLKLVCIAAVCMVLVSSAVVASLTCGQVTGQLSPCISYVQGKTSTPASLCCPGVRTINNMAKTTADRQTACRCLKAIAANIPSFNSGRAAGLPGKCGVSIPYTISPSTNCDTVK